MSDRDDLSLLPIGTDDPDSTDLSPAMEACARNLYQQAWREYTAIGCPYGPTDEAMLVWYSLHGDSPTPSLVTGKN
jgi:hypothetical protein